MNGKNHRLDDLGCSSSSNDEAIEVNATACSLMLLQQNKTLANDSRSLFGRTNNSLLSTPSDSHLTKIKIDARNGHEVQSSGGKDTSPSFPSSVGKSAPFPFLTNGRNKIPFITNAKLDPMGIQPKEARLQQHDDESFMKVDTTLLSRGVVQQLPDPRFGQDHGVLSISCLPETEDEKAAVARPRVVSLPGLHQPFQQSLEALGTSFDNHHNMLERMAHTNAVYFGWIRHAATKEWRDSVKVFSKNHQDYPSWHDDICDKVKDNLRAKGIYQFFICRKTDDSGGVERKKKIFDKNKKSTGIWSVATDQEVLDRTKQRFVDDRKPQVVVTGVKRPRGRPPKPLIREISSELLLPESDAKSLSIVLTKLQQIILKYKVDDKRRQIGSNQKIPKPKDGDKEVVVKPLAADVSDLDPSANLELKCDLEQIEHLIQKQAEAMLHRSTVMARSQATVVDAMDSSIASNDDDDDHEPPKKKKRLDPSQNVVTPVSKRKPWNTITFNDVCFAWNRHPGTERWRQVVNSIATSDKEWTDAVVDRVQEALLRLGNNEACSVFLECLDSQGQPCVSIRDGLWYIATKEEIRCRTKQQFDRTRHFARISSDP
jgi:hypothetical protein